jgi:hypothetical protein
MMDSDSRATTGDRQGSQFEVLLPGGELLEDLSTQDVAERVNDGRIGADCLIRQKGQQHWQSIGSAGQPAADVRSHIDQERQPASEHATAPPTAIGSTNATQPTVARIAWIWFKRGVIAAIFGWAIWWKWIRDDGGQFDFVRGTQMIQRVGAPQDAVAGVSLLHKAAERGHARAQFSLGWCYSQGKGAPKDEAEAVRWFRKAAEQGLAEAQCNLGWCYEQGKGVPEDEAEAVRWYRKAAEQGFAEAQHNLGVCYHSGRGVPKDEAEAVRWYRKAAEQGDAKAQINLSLCYLLGHDVPTDEVEAVRWLRKAAEQGDAQAQVVRAILRTASRCAAQPESVIHHLARVNTAVLHIVIPAGKHEPALTQHCSVHREKPDGIASGIADPESRLGTHVPIRVWSVCRELRYGECVVLRSMPCHFKCLRVIPDVMNSV